MIIKFIKDEDNEKDENMLLFVSFEDEKEEEVEFTIPKGFERAKNRNIKLPF